MLKTILNYINQAGLLWILCVRMFDIALPRWVQFGGMYIFVFTLIIEIVAEKRWQRFPVQGWLYYGLQLALFLLAFCYWPWDGNIYFHHHLEQRIPLLVFGLFGLFGINNRYSRATLIHALIILSVSSTLFLFFKSGWHNILFSPDRVFIVAENRIRYIGSHMVYNFYLNSSLIGIWYLLFHADRKPALWQKICYPIAACLIFSMLLLSDGRTGFFIGLVILGIMLVVELHKYNKWLGIGVSFFALAALIAISSLHPRISKQMLSNDLRYSYWKAAIELIEEKPIFGYGMSSAQEEFDKVNMKYVDEDNTYFWGVSQYHYIDCHNQFIQTTLEFGIIGLLIVLAIYFLPLFICWGKKEWWLAFFFTLISVWQSLFDMFLTGQFNIIYGLLLLIPIHIKDDYLCPVQQIGLVTSRAACRDSADSGSA